MIVEGEVKRNKCGKEANWLRVGQRRCLIPSVIYYLQNFAESDGRIVELDKEKFIINEEKIKFEKDLMYFM